MDSLKIFIKRMKKLGIKVELFSNYPWIYLHSVNGNRVLEKYEANHGFTIAFLPLRKEDKFEFTNITEIFKIIRKYR